MNIEQWTKELARAWEQHDIEAAVGLFTSDAEYWESPFWLVPPESLNELWQDVKGCLNTKVNSRVYSSQQNKHSIVWQATWQNEAGEKFDKAGVYLVTLNDSGKCNYFYRTSISKEEK